MSSLSIRLATHGESRHDAGMGTAFSRALRFCWWIVGVVAVVNIESWATKNGYGSLWTGHITPDSPIADLLDFFTDPLTTHIAAFIAGGILLAWLSYWFELVDNKHGGPPEWMQRSRIETALAAIKKGKKKYSGHTTEELCARANLALKHFGLFQIDDAVLVRDDVRVQYQAYLAAILSLLESKAPDAAKRVSDNMQVAIEAIIAEPLLQLGIGSETPL